MKIKEKVSKLNLLKPLEENELFSVHKDKTTS